MRTANKTYFLAIVIASGMFFFSCGNLVHDELGVEDPVEIDVSPSSEIFGSVIRKDLSISGNIVVSAENDSSYVVAGSIVTDQDKDNIWIANYNRDGSLKWQGILQSDDSDRIRKIEFIDDQSYFIIADRYYDDGDIDALVVKMSVNNGIIWQLCLGDSNKNRVFDTLLTDDNKLIIAGISYYLADINVYTPFVIKLDMDGLIVWRHDYRNNFYYMQPSSILAAGDGNYVMSGVCLTEVASKLKTFYTVLDEDGNALRSCIISAFLRHTQLIGNTITNKKILSVISIEETSLFQPVFSIITIDTDFVLKDQKDYSLPDFSLKGRLVEGENDDIFIGGLIKDEENTDNGVYLMRFLKNGKIKDISTKIYNDKPALLNVEFSGKEVNSEIPFACRISTDNEDGSKDLFFDAFKTEDDSDLLKINPVKSVSKVSATTTGETTELEQIDMEIVSEDSYLYYKENPGLTFVVQ